MIEVLISEGADLDRGTRSEGLTDWSYPTVIFIIFYPRYIRVSKKLIYILDIDQCSIEMKMSFRMKPLMMAAQHKNCDVAILALLNHGADPNIVDYNVSSHGTP